MWQIIGLKRAVSLLKHSVDAGAMAHAYLFIGPEHVGKMTLALNLAQALNCEAADRPCLECNSCRKIAAGNHADVQIIGLTQKKDEDEESKQISIDQIRDMQHDASLPPFEGKNKVFIIDGAELMSQEASNCLLKILEEPEKNVTFILLATNEKKLLPTVVSRCQRIELPPLSIDEETKALIERGAPPEKARLLAGLSHGCPGWALAAVNDETVLERREEELNRVTGIIKADFEERFDYVARLAAGFTKDRSAVYDVLNTWLDYWRDLMLVRLGHANMMTNIDRKDELTGMANNYSLAAIKDFMKSIEAAAEQLGKNVNPRLALEVLMIDIPKEVTRPPVVSGV